MNGEFRGSFALFGAMPRSATLDRRIAKTIRELAKLQQRLNDARAQTLDARYPPLKANVHCVPEPLSPEKFEALYMAEMERARKPTIPWPTWPWYWLGVPAWWLREWEEQESLHLGHS